jgi:bacterial/archaeal transporter family protein
MTSSLLIIMMIVGWGVGSFFYKIACVNIHPIIVSTLVTSLYMLLTPFAWGFMKFDHRVNTIGVTAAVVGGAFICMASVAYFYALQKGSAGEVTLLSSMYPGLTLLLSILFLGEPLTIKKCVGILLAGASFYFLSGK